MKKVNSSVSATELAKLGKCDMLIKSHNYSTSNSFQKKSSHNSNTRLGEEIHKQYEGETSLFMSSKYRKHERTSLVLWLVVVAIIGAAFLDVAL